MSTPLIRLRPFSDSDPDPIEATTYSALIQNKQGGWSHCSTEQEWLAKLHYLREGYTQGKIEHEAFLAREFTLIDSWLRVIRSSQSRRPQSPTSRTG